MRKEYIIPSYEVEIFNISVDVLTASTDDHFLIHSSKEVQFEEDFDW